MLINSGEPAQSNIANKFLDCGCGLIRFINMNLALLGLHAG